MLSSCNCRAASWSNRCSPVNRHTWTFRLSFLMPFKQPNHFLRTQESLERVGTDRHLLFWSVTTPWTLPEVWFSLACSLQFFQRAQMQTARPTIPTNSPSIRPGSQAPTAAVYPTNQPIVMTMAPMPFHSAQTQYYIPQVHSMGGGVLKVNICSLWGGSVCLRGTF